jgi:hypothetical protein
MRKPFLQIEGACPQVARRRNRIFRKEEYQLGAIASAQGQVFWPSIDLNCMSRNFINSKDNYEKTRRSTPYINSDLL